jgi:hypothetical protein
MKKFQIKIKDLGASPGGMNRRKLLKNCEASLGELNPLEGLKTFLLLLLAGLAGLFAKNTLKR